MTGRALSILHFSTADRLGGSAQSAYRIHSTLRSRGHRSRMLVGIRITDDPDVDTVWSGHVGRLANRLADEATARVGLQYQYLPSTRRVLRHPWVAQADAIQIYNTHGGYFATRMLPRLSQRAPIVWRLSDMWPMTGHCAYAGECERWRSGCGQCPDLRGHPAIGVDATAWLWRQKMRFYERSRVTVVAPSSWIERLARESPLLQRFRVQRIPNGIDLDAFHPRDRPAARRQLEIDPQTTVVLFVAHGLDDNPRKGDAHAIEALRRLGGRPRTLCLLAGEGGERWQAQVPIPVRRLGFIDDPQLLAAAYRAADVFLAPSLLENLPNSVLEALASGVPSVAYDTGGMGDAVRHLETGWLAAQGDLAGLTEGVRHLVEDDALRKRLGAECRRLAEREYARDLEARRFESLYREVLAAN
jgi:glycosyltransferase involved in cell wall biosynthesis